MYIDSKGRSKNDPAQNRSEAERFLASLDQQGVTHTFQLFADRGRELKPELLHLPLEVAWNHLCEKNNDGYAVCVLINKGDLQGRASENIQAIRALFVDLDGPPVEPVLSAAVPPHFVIETSPGRFHAYWFVNDCGLKDFSRLQTALAEKFGGDQSVKDLPRVMRLPGTFHSKKAVPFVSRIYAENSIPRYQVGDVIKGLELEDAAKKKKTASAQPPIIDWKLADAEEMLRHVSPDISYAEWIKAGMALHSRFPNDDGLKVFIEWSRTSGKFKMGECEEKWSSFSDAVSHPVTFGTLVWMARKGGYKNHQISVERRYAYQDYVEFFYGLPDVLEFRREILRDELMIRTSSGWCSALNRVDWIASHAVDAGLPVSHTERHLNRLKIELEPRLLLEEEEWDGQDRVWEICEKVKVKELDADELYELLTTWGPDIFRRLKDNTLQPMTLILTGPQGVGKDTLVDALTGGLGDYVAEVNIGEENAEQCLHEKLVFKITEFDRTVKANPATIKKNLTKSSTYVRLPYDRRPELRKVRCSYISTCNVQDMFTDYTGARRYWVLTMEYGGFPPLSEGSNLFKREPDCAYPGMFASADCLKERRQIIAQFKALAETERRMTPALEKKLREMAEHYSPEDPHSDAVSLLDEFVTENLDQLSPWEKENQIVSNATLEKLGIWKIIHSQTGQTVRTIKGALKRAARSVHRSDGNYYKFERLKKERRYSALGDVIDDDTKDD